MKKGDIVLSFLIALVIGLILYGSTAAIVAKFFRLSDAGLESFNQLATQINAMKDRSKGEMEATSLYMDKDTIIAFFNKGVDPLISKNVKVMNLLISNMAKVDSTVIIPRPAACDRTKTCTCLLREFKVEYGSNSQEMIITPNQFNCRELELNLLYSNSGTSVPFIFRSKGLEGKDQSRERAVFIEKGYGSLFGFCETSPCLTQTTGDVLADTSGLDPDQFINELISKSYTLLRVQRSGAEIVKVSPDCPDPNPMSKPVQLQFASWDNGEIDFIYDAKENKAYARDKGKDILWDYKDVYQRWELEDKAVFDDVKENWEYYDVIIPILNAKTFENFYNSITKMTKDYKDIYLIDGTSILGTTDAEFVKSKIEKNRPNYFTSWINPGKCKVSTAAYDCYILGNTQGKCNLEASGNICIVGAEKKCGETCFCPENYLEKDIFGFSIGDQEWEFEITADKKIAKRCIYNCPVK